MVQRLGDRWLTALVIIAIGAIFLPIWLSHYKIFQSKVHYSGWIPQPISVKTVPASFLTTQAETQQFLATPVGKQNAQVTLAASAINRYVAMPRAWLVQVASFDTFQNANALQQRLQLHGFIAYLVTVKKNDVTLYRVMVGPFFTKLEAQQQIPKLGKLINLKMLVLPFTADL